MYVYYNVLSACAPVIAFVGPGAALPRRFSRVCSPLVANKGVNLSPQVPEPPLVRGEQFADLIKQTEIKNRSGTRGAGER